MTLMCKGTPREDNNSRVIDLIIDALERESAIFFDITLALLFNEQTLFFSLTINQHKQQHKPNFSEAYENQGVRCDFLAS